MADERKVLTHTAEQLDEATEKVLSGTLADKSAIRSVLLSTEWTGSSSPYTQVVTIDGTTANSKVDLQPDASVITQMAKDDTVALYIANANGTLTAYAIGEKPTVSLTVQATVTEVSA